MNDSEKVFFDTAPFIYLIENNPTFYQTVSDLIFELVKSNVVFHTSVLTQTEFSVQPMKLGRIDLITDYETLISEMAFEVHPIVLSIAKRAAELRAKYQSLKTLDALQLATALENACNQFITNDKGLKRIDENNMKIVANNDTLEYYKKVT